MEKDNLSCEQCLQSFPQCENNTVQTNIKCVANQTPSLFANTNFLRPNLNVYQYRTIFKNLVYVPYRTVPQENQCFSRYSIKNLVYCLKKIQVNLLFQENCKYHKFLIMLPKNFLQNRYVSSTKTDKAFRILFTLMFYNIHMILSFFQYFPPFFLSTIFP